LFSGEGDGMLEVFFETKNEVIWFCDSLFQGRKEIEMHWKTDKTWGNRLQLTQDDGAVSEIVAAMASVFMKYRLPDMLQAIIQKRFYYTNTDEIERIHELAYGMFIDGALYQEVVEQETMAPIEVVRNIFMDSMQDKQQIHFDSIVKFRLPVIQEKLIYYVGLAIDEFKREEDHQAFIEGLREHIAARKSHVGVVHILQGETFRFYQANGLPFSRDELRHLLQRDPVFFSGLPPNEWNLAPLIAMNPERLCIYGADPTEPKTLTVINVFQEKAVVLPLSSFPFSAYRKNNSDA